MTNEQAIDIIRNEYKCVDRDCDIERSCGKCPYMIPTKEPILQAYDMAIQALEQEPCIYDLKNKYCPKTYEKIYMQGFLKAKEIFMSELQGKKIITQEPCEDAISREAVIKLFNGNIGSEAALIFCRVKQLPSVTPSRRKGRWINDKNDIPICSQCGYIPQYDRAIDDYEYSNYCPSCGAEMIEPQERSDKE